LDTELISDAKQVEDSRRSFLKKAAIFTGGAIISQSELFASSEAEKALKLRAIHQGKDYYAEFYEKDSYKISGLFEINKAFMDTRAQEITRIDIELINLLYEINLRVGIDKKFNIVSGYRTPQTNTWLRHQLGGQNVAKNSYHMKGQAVDIFVADVPLHKLRDIARSLKRGGVGYYPKKGFIHVDVGPERYWRRG
jgi:uncharacterized protein YcbK (DUF882 family)